jgi:hypothetical protein
MVSVVIFFEGVNVVSRYRHSLYGDDMLWDEQLLAADTFFLGYFFPRGQLTLL